MAISDNDEQLARRLIEALHRHQAGWIAAEVEAAREQRTDFEEDVRMLLVAIARTLGILPSLVMASAGALGEIAGRRVPGVIMGDRELAFDRDTMAEMDELRQAADILRAPVAELLDSGHELEDA